MMNDNRNYGNNDLYNNRTLIAEQAVRRSLPLNGGATITVNSDTDGVELPSRFTQVGPVQFVVENHGRENGFVLSSLGFQASILIEGVITQVAVPYQAVMQITAHKTRRVEVVHPVLCVPIQIGEYPTGQAN